MVKAKFKVQKIERQSTSVCVMDESGKPKKDERGNYVYEPGEMQTIVMNPVYANGDPNHENTKFWAASPSGELRLGCVNEAASRYFELNAEYYLDFTKAE